MTVHYNGTGERLRFFRSPQCTSVDGKLRLKPNSEPYITIPKNQELIVHKEYNKSTSGDIFKLRVLCEKVSLTPYPSPMPVVILCNREYAIAARDLGLDVQRLYVPVYPIYDTLDYDEVIGYGGVVGASNLFVYSSEIVKGDEGVNPMDYAYQQQKIAIYGLSRR